jgi:hypothetical protein
MANNPPRTLYVGDYVQCGTRCGIVTGRAEYWLVEVLWNGATVSVLVKHDALTKCV